MSNISIGSFINSLHREEVVRLWHTIFGYGTAHNEPSLVIDQKLAMDDDLFYVAVCEEKVVGTLMAGYDGHRGWLYSLAVLPDYRHRDIGSNLVRHAEQALTRKGCLKINLQIMEGNEGVQAFYASLGYAVEVRVSMGKRFPVK
ncbi:GNAT family acetyltransferase [Prosthecobacter sp. SYSU 5D2]|uniref:GNAT family acetyltransferase n=1 Tax=Prosthecobacter sp. SYSU 5D2 TaxID=3134134 RepID=UPI0031FEF320